MTTKRKNRVPALAERKIRDLLVFGEEKETDSGIDVVYPSYRDIAARYNIAASTVSEIAKKHRTGAARKEIQARVSSAADDKLIERRASVMAFTTDMQLQTIDEWLAKFAEQLEAGNVRCDDPKDLERMLRLRLTLAGGADRKVEHEHTFTLDELARRYMENRKGSANSDVVDAEIIEPKRVTSGEANQIENVARGPEPPHRGSASDPNTVSDCDITGSGVAQDETGFDLYDPTTGMTPPPSKEPEVRNEQARKDIDPHVDIDGLHRGQGGRLVSDYPPPPEADAAPPRVPKPGSSAARRPAQAGGDGAAGARHPWADADAEQDGGRE